MKKPPSLKTKNGNRIDHPRWSFLEKIIEDIKISEVAEFKDYQILTYHDFNFYDCYRIQKDAIEGNYFEQNNMLEELLKKDYLLRLLQKYGSSQTIHESDSIRPILTWLNNANLTINKNTLVLRGPEIESIDDFKNNKSEFGIKIDLRLYSKIEGIWRNLPPVDRALALMASDINNVSFLWGLAFACKKISPGVCAQGIQTTYDLLNELDRNNEIIRVSRILFDQSENETGLKFDILQSRNWIQKMVTYKHAYNNESDSNPNEIISAGESSTVEFKSTLRFHTHLKKSHDDITHSCLKTIAAFLNTEGGKLLIGVSDKGEIVGIKSDGFPDNDKYQLHLFNLMKEYLGSHIASLVSTDMVEVDDKVICLVKCNVSPEPVYLNFKKRGEEYFIRTGPGTTKLSTSEAHKYITNKFSN